MDDMPHILLVEDDTMISRLVRMMLETRGWLSTVVDDGEKAIRLCGDGSFDLVVMDLQIPVLSGFEAARQIRRLEKEKGVPPVPIVALSAHVSRKIREECFRCGMNDYLPKPIHMEKFFATLEIHLTWDARLRHAAAPAAEHPLE